MEKMQINVLIVDDDPVSLEQSKENILLFVEEGGIHTAMNSVQVMRILQSVPVDLAFVDIEMTDTDGFTMAGYIQSAQPRAQYVFLTGHTELGAKSYDYEPLDFLCKPVNALRLKKTFERFEKSRAPRRGTNEQVAVESTAGFVLISPADILYITREGRKTVIDCSTQRYMVRNPLEELELIFGEFDLFRCHQSYLVSLPHITSAAQADFGRTYWAVLDNGSQVPVSRNRYADLRRRLGEYGVHFL